MNYNMEDIEGQKVESTIQSVPEHIDVPEADPISNSERAAEAYTTMAFTKSGMNDIDRAIEQRKVNRQSLIDLFKENEQVLEKRKRTDRSVAIGQAIGELLGAFAGTAISPDGRAIVPEDKSSKSYEKYLKSIEQGNANRNKLQTILNQFDSDTANLYGKKADAEAKYNIALARYNSAIEKQKLASEAKLREIAERGKNNLELENQKAANKKVENAAKASQKSAEKDKYNFTTDELAKAQQMAEIFGVGKKSTKTQDKFGISQSTTTENSELTKSQTALMLKVYDEFSNITDSHGNHMTMEDLANCFMEWKSRNKDRVVDYDDILAYARRTFGKI